MSTQMITMNVYNTEIQQFQTYIYDFIYNRYLLKNSHYFNNTRKKLHQKNNKTDVEKIKQKANKFANDNKHLEITDLDIISKKFTPNNVFQCVLEKKLI